MIKPDTILPCNNLSDEGYKVVAVIGWINDFAVYQYYTTSSDRECASNGDKIGEDQARRLFPELASYKYRR
jgi:hypothetical protein